MSMRGRQRAERTRNSMAGWFTSCSRSGKTRVHVSFTLIEKSGLLFACHGFSRVATQSKRLAMKLLDHLVTNFVACGHGKGRSCVVNVIALFPDLDLELRAVTATVDKSRKLVANGAANINLPRARLSGLSSPGIATDGATVIPIFTDLRSVTCSLQN
jgi:hypothetical protein